MKLTFNTKDVQKLVAHARQSKEFRLDAQRVRSLMLCRDDGIYLMSSGLPELKDGKHDEFLVHARKHKEDGQLKQHKYPQVMILNGAWLDLLERVTSDTFTLVQTKKQLKLVEGKVKRIKEELKEKAEKEEEDSELFGRAGTMITADDLKAARGEAVKKAEKKARKRGGGKPKGPALKDGITLQSICAELKLDPRKTRMKLRSLRRAGKLADNGGRWEWTPEQATGVKALLGSK